MPLRKAISWVEIIANVLHVHVYLIARSCSINLKGFNMRKNMIYISIVIMSIITTDVIAGGKDCNSLTTVYGTVDTINVSETIQVGTIHLQLMAENGTVKFEENGAIVGRVTSSDPETGESTLDHHIFFADGSRIETEGDQAQITSFNSECSFNVSETISNFWGTKKFKRASGEIYAIGVVSFCDGENGNHFELSGTVCLK